MHDVISHEDAPGDALSGALMTLAPPPRTDHHAAIFADFRARAIDLIGMGPEITDFQTTNSIWAVSETAKIKVSDLVTVTVSITYNKP